MISSAIFFIAVASTSTKYQALVLILWGATLLYFGIFQALILYWLPQYMESHLENDCHNFFTMYVVGRSLDIRRERIEDLREGLTVLVE
mmetsp:Transcript_18160/g.17296  ORF Transcript_18160/g.17296 Transcript_18160/m.17296 type:complete len:89 (-) Transcript_18160:234-500(-)